MNCFPKKSAECIGYVPFHPQTNQQWHNRAVFVYDNICRRISYYHLLFIIAYLLYQLLIDYR